MPYVSNQTVPESGDDEKCAAPPGTQKPLVYGPSARGALRARAEELDGELLSDLEKPMEQSWTQFSLQTLDGAAAAGRPVIFDLSNMKDIPGILDGTAYQDAVTSKELRHIKDNWSDFKDNVYFCKDGKRQDPPW